MLLTWLTGLLAQLEPSMGWADFALRGGAYGLLLIVFWMLVTKRLVFGWAYMELREDRDYWRRIALDGLRVGERAVQLVKETTRP
ncbi:MAG: hypothetical protein ACRDM7_13100 [Thermoleophilaceae bacterium]